MREKPDSILIIKLSAIGDVIHTLPFLEVLRDNFPDARIDWLVEEEASQIIEGHEGIDRVIISHRKSWQTRVIKGKDHVRVVKEVVRFLKELRSEEYDLVIDLQGLFKSGILTGLSKGKRKIGSTGSREGSSFFLTERPYPVDYNQHALDRYLKLIKHLKCDKDSWKGSIPIRDSDKRSIDKLIHENGIQDKRLVAINPMARWKTKLWDSERFAILANRIHKELSCTVIFTGGRDDRSRVVEIIDRMDEMPINLTGQTSLKELAYLYSRCRLMISTDTGPMHMAAAMDCPVVALFGPTAPWRTGPYGKGHRVVRGEAECSPCFKKRCDHMTCMREITAERAFESVKQLLM